MRLVSLVLCVALLGGCFGYNGSAKRWAYVGDVILIAGGGAAMALDQTNKPAACEGSSCPYQSPIRGGMVAGALLVGAVIGGIARLRILHHALRRRRAL